MRLSRGGAATTPAFTMNTFEAEASVSMPSRNMMVSTAPASADIWRASTLPSSEVDLMWHFSQRKSRAVTQATPFSTASRDGFTIGLDIMNTVGTCPGESRGRASAARRA